VGPCTPSLQGHQPALPNLALSSGSAACSRESNLTRPLRCAHGCLGKHVSTECL
jgi:hypothetical protein